MTGVHEWDESCKAFHCEFHGRDELGNIYIRCAECGHLYRSAWALSWQLRKWLLKMLFTGEWKWRQDFFHASLFKLLKGIVAVRVEKVNFCQFCAHDF